MASLIEPFTQADGLLGNGWTDDSGFGASDPGLRVTANKCSTNNFTTFYIGLKAHGLDVTGDWQIDFDADVTLVTSGGGVRLGLVDGATFAGYSAFIGNATHIQVMAVGGGTTNITNDGRTQRINHVTFTGTAAGDLAIYLDGVLWSNNNDVTQSAGDTIFVSLYEASSPTVEGTIDNLVIQDFIGTSPPITPVRELGGSANSSAGTTMTVTVPAGGVPIGDAIIISGACDNTGTSGAATTVAGSDTKGNSYVLPTPQALADPGAVSAGGVQGFFLVCVVTVALVSGDVITVTLGNSTVSKAIQVQQWNGIRLVSPVLSYTVANDLTGTATTISRTPTATGQLIMVLDAIEGATSETFTQDSDSVGGTWVTIARRGSGAGVAGITVRPSYKLVANISAQTWNPVMGTARDHCAAAMLVDFEPDAGSAVIRPSPVVPTVAVHRASRW